MQVKVCLVQESPVFFDKTATLRKVEEITRERAASGAQLIVFPESFVPGYPRGFTFGAVIGRRDTEGRELYAEYHRNSFEVEGADGDWLARLARETGVYIALGVTERRKDNNSLYCSLVYASPTAGILGVHRKIKPTGTERLVWAEADGRSLVTFQTAIGRLGGLICWENYMPAARMSMYQKGVQIYLAPTADSRDAWTASMRHIALEGRCFVLGCNQYFTKSMYPERLMGFVKDEPEDMCRGGSLIVSPLGEIIAGPLFDRAGYVEAELELADILGANFDFDVNGHYDRPDIFAYRAVGQPALQRE